MQLAFHFKYKCLNHYGWFLGPHDWKASACPLHNKSENCRDLRAALLLKPEAAR